MKKSLKIVFGMTLGIILLWGSIFFIDYNRCANLKMPIFVIKEKTVDKSKDYELYYGLGYKVQAKKNLDSNELLKLEMYMFNKFIVGAITDNVVDTIDVETNGNYNNYENSQYFRATVIDSSLDSIIVTPIDIDDKKILSDMVEIKLEEGNDILYPKGSELYIFYTGKINDSYPGKINVINIQTEKQYRGEIEKIPQDYDLISGIKDKCVINIHNRTFYNKDELDRFIDNVNNNVPDFIRCISYTIEGDMIINEVDFDGNESFRYVLDCTRDEFSGKDDRKYFYEEFKKMEVLSQDNFVSIELKEPVEGNLKEAVITGYEKDTKIVNNYEFKYLLDIKSTGNKNITKITENVLKDKFNYDIYYYGIESCKIDILNNKIDLIEALKEDKITMEQIIEQAEKDGEAGIIPNDTYKDGGSKIYFYDNYTIIKKHTENGNEDVYIGVPEMRLNDI